MSSDYICLYTGLGASQTCAAATKESLIKILGEEGERRVIPISHPGDLSSSKCLQRGNTIVIPGGHARVLRDKLFEFSAHKIADFIQGKRGCYIGICAGAYIAGNSAERLNLFNLTNTYNCSMSTSENVVCLRYDEGTRPVEILDAKTQKSLKLIWLFGGSYDTPENSEEVVAYYQPQSFNRVAVLKPQRNVLLSNVHPEFQISEKYYDLNLTKDQRDMLSSSKEVKQWFESQLVSMGIKKADQDVKEPLREVLKDEISHEKKESDLQSSSVQHSNTIEDNQKPSSLVSIYSSNFSSLESASFGSQEKAINIQRVANSIFSGKFNSTPHIDKKSNSEI